MDHESARSSSEAGHGGQEGEWQQQAGFSVFFDQRIVDQNVAEWRTRLYHDEADEAISTLGLDPGGWMPWIVERIPAADHRDTQRLVGVEVVGVKAILQPGVDSNSAYFEIGLRIDGLSDLGQAVGATVIAAALSALAS